MYGVIDDQRQYSYAVDDHHFFCVLDHQRSPFFPTGQADLPFASPSFLGHKSPLSIWLAQPLFDNQNTQQKIGDVVLQSWPRLVNSGKKFSVGAIVLQLSCSDEPGETASPEKSVPEIRPSRRHDLLSWGA